MKVLHLLGNRRLPPDPDTHGVSGVVYAALEIARAQVALGHQVTVASVGTARWRSTWRGVNLLGLSETPWAKLTLNGRTLDFRLHLPYMLLTRARRFDIIHSHLYNYLRFLPARGRVVHFHSDPYYQRAGIAREALSPADFATIDRYSDVRVAPSQFVVDALRKGFGTDHNLFLVHNGIDHQRYSPQQWQDQRARMRQQWGFGPERVVFLFAGALVPEKGVVHLLRAFVRLLSDTPGAALVLAGATDLWTGQDSQRVYAYQQELQATISVAGDSGAVHFLGKVHTREMPAVFAASDVVVVPSVWQEAFGIVALEALAAGRPVIASATGGLVETVNAENGILVPPGDERALEQAMRWLAADADLRQRLGNMGCIHARKFCWESAANQLNHIYWQAIAAKEH